MMADGTVRALTESHAKPMPKMHADEIDIDASLVRRLLAEQLPRWADLPLVRVESSGTDNALFRLGADKVVRLPRIAGARGQIEKEFRWLPMLAPHLPLAVPMPLARGVPGEGFPWEWGVYSWVQGETATAERIADARQAASDLAGFIRALWRIDPAGAPPSSRGVSLVRRDRYTRAAIGDLRGKLDTEALTAAWEAAVAVPPFEGSPVWIHGDLYDGNLLVDHGRLSAVIDFGVAGIGDPAADLIVAWSQFSGEARDVLREELDVDGDTWARGRGWALSVALIAIPYYETTNPVMVANARRRIEDVLADHASGA